MDRNLIVLRAMQFAYGRIFESSSQSYLPRRHPNSVNRSSCKQPGRHLHASMGRLNLPEEYFLEILTASASASDGIGRILFRLIEKHS